MRYHKDCYDLIKIFMLEIFQTRTTKWSESRVLVVLRATTK
jgi:hypothetical protein